MSRTIVTAELIKRKTEDGLVEMNDDIPIGKIYQVDLSTIRTGKGLNTVHNIKWEREVIDVKDDDAGDWRWMPTELLSIWKE